VSPVEYEAARTNLFQGESLAELDADDDGVISEEEAEAYPPLAEAFDRVDANEDGLIDKAEYAAAQR
jgi:Ca2+-binding EF-hand superfamily protein